ncbi:efflux RND transporter periplasmic adaptor subunit [Microvirga sp. 2MCAF35]|uniref:efflux RND transporter periplasmic adaptor subunit n=1 Tax=Microvirga sp. 2MCAF35 TaxID=3232987 RepID=UPI003F9A48BD
MAPEGGPTEATDTRRPWLRRTLLILGPLVVAAAALAFYLSGGRYVSEENAYVQAATVSISPQVTGAVAQVLVRDNQQVSEGDVLFTIDQEPYRIALAGAQAQLGVTRDQLAGMVETYRSRQAQVKQAQANLDFAQAEFDRMNDLVRRGVSSQAQLDEAQRNLSVAQAALTTAREEAATILAQLGGDGDMPLEQRPQYRQAQANVDTAERNLRLAEVRAPFTGIATNVDAIQPGMFLTAGQQAISMVSSTSIWVEANIKETDLTDVRVGNPVGIEVDAYPNVRFQGQVQSINPASGATFALLPAQNASGNWVKVVQRIPVQISVQQPGGGPQLRAGMSATVSIDTGQERSLSQLWRDLRESL